MLDMARVTERYGHYMDMARSAGSWGYNTIFAHVTDNEGCAVIFESRPELASPHALTREQVGEWIAAAGEHGVMIVPEIECFGHTRFIHDLPQYKHLAMPASGHFNAINPLHPETHAILHDVLRDTAALFESPYIHAGFDEVNLGDRTVLGGAAAGKADWELFADMVNLVHGMIKDLGKRMMIWGDHLVSEPRIAERIDKDIIICDWQYHADLTGKSTEALIGMGFDVVCCPSSSRSSDMMMPRANTQGNLQRFARIAHASGDRIKGLVNTVWCPGRMLCGTELFAFALGGAWFDDPEADPVAVVSRFVSERYGVDEPEALAEAILSLSALIPHNSLPRRIMQTETSKKAPPGPITAVEAREMAAVAGSVAEIRPIFEAHQKTVVRHGEEFANYLLVCDLIGWFSRLGKLRICGEAGEVQLSVVGEGTRLIERCREDWRRRRYDDDPKRDQDTYGERDGLITNLTRAVRQLGEGNTARAQKSAVVGGRVATH